MVNRIYQPELQLNKGNTSFWIHIYFSSAKAYDKRDDFDIDIVNFPLLDGDVPSYGVYNSQLIRFDSVCSHLDNLNARDKCLTAKLLNQGYLYHYLRKAFQSSITDIKNWFQNTMSD